MKYQHNLIRADIDPSVSRKVDIQVVPIALRNGTRESDIAAVFMHIHDDITHTAVGRASSSNLYMRADDKNGESVQETSRKYLITESACMV
jgi:hypothetical protein